MLKTLPFRDPRYLIFPWIKQPKAVGKVRYALLSDQLGSVFSTLMELRYTLTCCCSNIALQPEPPFWVGLPNTIAVKSSIKRIKFSDHLISLSIQFRW